MPPVKPSPLRAVRVAVHEGIGLGVRSIKSPPKSGLPESSLALRFDIPYQPCNGEFVLTENMYERIKQLKVPLGDLSDAHRMLGFECRVADAALRPAVPFSRLVGTAVTLREYLGDGESNYIEQVTEMYDRGRSVPRAVLVIRNEVPGFTCMGSGGARVSLAHGYVGSVVDGAIRDTQEMPDLDFPLYGTSVRPHSILIDQVPPGKSIYFELGVPVEIAGISITPGDIIVSDNDGLMAIAPAHLEAVVAEAEKITSLEGRLFARLATGMTFRECVLADSEFAALAKAGSGEPLPTPPKEY
jgi:4-hydroxy-4-methyl-2-oxoglutarate aldolase